jgi:hypothetical protein
MWAWGRPNSRWTPARDRSAHPLPDEAAGKRPGRRPDPAKAARPGTADGTETTITIVGIDEADFARSQVSWVSPIARALLKAREGDTV